MATRMGRDGYPGRGRLPWLFVLLAGFFLAWPGMAPAETPLPPERLRQAGMEAWDAGRPLTALHRLQQYLAREPGAPDRAVIDERIATARAAVIAAAPAGSLVIATVEQRRAWDEPGAQAVARLHAHAGRVTVQTASGPTPQSPDWQRAGEALPAAYAAFLERLLVAPALSVHLPLQAFDPNLPGPRRAATVSIRVGDDEWQAQGLRGEAWERLSEMAGWVLEFARTTPLTPEAGRR